MGWIYRRWNILILREHDLPRWRDIKIPVQYNRTSNFALTGHWVFMDIDLAIWAGGEEQGMEDGGYEAADGLA